MAGLYEQGHEFDDVARRLRGAAVGPTPVRVTPDRVIARGRRLHRRRVAGAGAGLTCLLGLAIGSVALATPGDESRQVVVADEGGPSMMQDSTDCQVPKLASAKDRRWAGAAPAQAAAQRTQGVLAQRFPQDTKIDPIGALRQGLIGVALDPVAHAVTVVVDPGRVDSTALERELTAGAGAGVGEPVVRVHSACHSADALVQAYDFIKSGSWIAAGEPRSYRLFLDAATSAFQVRVSTEAQAAALQSELGDRVNASSRVGLPDSAGKNETD